MMKNRFAILILFAAGWLIVSSIEARGIVPVSGVKQRVARRTIVQKRKKNRRRRIRRSSRRKALKIYPRPNDPCGKVYIDCW